MSAHVRIGRVRLKSGGEVRLLPLVRHEGRDAIMRSVRACLDEQVDPAGFAFVVWDADLSSSASHWSGPGSGIPSILIPDFIRNRLLALQIERWTIDSVNQSNGYPPDDAS